MRLKIAIQTIRVSLLMCAQHASPLDCLMLDNTFDGEILLDEPMSRHTSYAIGGPARYYARVDSLSALSELRKACLKENVQIEVIGRGTNLLVSDGGFSGAIVVLGRDFRNHYVSDDGETIVAGAAASLSTIVQEALRSAISGMEFAVGTPGSVGGAIRMNAGSASDWIGSRIRRVTLLNSEGLLEMRRGTDVEWGYRTTSFLPDEIVLECELSLSKGDPFFIQGKMEASLNHRKKTQPLGRACCGSVFRNPPNTETQLSAAKMIDDLGFKGMRIGGASVSDIHANFIVNEGNAKASDVVRLMDAIRTKVLKEYGIELTPEVKFLGF